MARPRSTARTVLALLLLAIVAAVCLSLGRWQLQRAAERDVRRSTFEKGQQLPPITLKPNTGNDYHPWQTARAEGEWLQELTVLLMNRNYKGVPGYWVITPLLLSNSNNTAVLVLRGWLPQQKPPQDPSPKVPANTGLVQINGALLKEIPRLYELPSLFRERTETPLLDDWKQGELPVRQNLAIADFAQASQLTLLPTILQQAPSANISTPFVRDWDTPRSDSATNRGYALQWFGFSAIALIAIAFISWRQWLRPRLGLKQQ